MIEARVVADSINPWGHRLTTMEVTFHRWLLAEVNTARVLSRSSASSRAIPMHKMLKPLIDNPAMPIKYQYNQPGMQSARDMSATDARIAEQEILKLRDAAVNTVEKLASIGPLDDKGKPLGLHKQWANRYIEPWVWHKAIISSTYWANLFDQRISPLAQPEFDLVARCMKAALNGSTPTLLQEGEWHLPYVQDFERTEFTLKDQTKLSTARCARVSYLNHEGKRDIEGDFRLYSRLEDPGDGPPHAAPTEMVATPCEANSRTVELRDFHGEPNGRFLELPEIGNFLGWDQLRHRVMGF